MCHPVSRFIILITICVNLYTYQEIWNDISLLSTLSHTTQLRKQPKRRTFLPEPETAAERAARVAMAEAGNGDGALFVLMDAIRGVKIEQTSDCAE